MRMSILYKHAGLITVWHSNWSIHLFPKYWYLGYSKSWCDGWLCLFGVGPLFLITWDELE